jgi:hypothetical protein
MFYLQEKSISVISAIFYFGHKNAVVSAEFPFQVGWFEGRTGAK